MRYWYCLTQTLALTKAFNKRGHSINLSIHLTQTFSSFRGLSIMPIFLNHLRRLLGYESETNEHISEHHMTSRFKQFFQQTNFHRFYRNRIVDSKSNLIITAKIFVAAFCQLLYNVFKEYQIETITYKYKIFVMQTCYIERKMNVDNLQDIKLTPKRSIVQ